MDTESFLGISTPSTLRYHVGDSKRLLVARHMSNDITSFASAPTDAKLNAWHILARARPGAIIILHDNRKWTAETLRIVLPGLKERGFSVVSVGELRKRGRRFRDVVK